MKGIGGSQKPDRLKRALIPNVEMRDGMFLEIKPVHVDRQPEELRNARRWDVSMGDALRFRLTCLSRAPLLVALLTAVLRPRSPIREARVINPEITCELPRDRSVVLDIRFALDDGRQVDVEMQIQVRMGTPAGTAHHRAVKAGARGAR